jgi:cell division protein ZapA (FtsZ GTPase activity inhibitor)
MNMSSEDKTRINVDIYGMQYKLAGHSSSTHMRRVAEHVDEHMHKIGKGFPKLDTPRLAVLAAVNIADGFLKLKDDMESHRMGMQNVMVEEHQALANEHTRLQQELQSTHTKLADAEAREQDYKLRLEKLQEEYAKLQTEYNEWIQLASLDQTEPNS